MAFQYQFSVGTMSVGSNDLGILTELNVSYDGNPQSFYGGDYRLPLAVELGNRTGQITASSARFDTTDACLDNAYVDVTLATGRHGGGLTGSILNCKVSNYDLRSTQDAYVTSNLTLIMTSQEAQDATHGGSWPSWA